jgi:hypothetical protein
MTAPDSTAAPVAAFTVFRRGEAVEFTTAHTITTAADALASSRSDFAQDLLVALRSGHISRTQATWLLYLAEDAAPTVNRPEAHGAEFVKLRDVVNTMQQQANESAAARNRNAGKVTLRFVGASVSAVIQGPNTGCLYVKTDGAYMGKIDRSGVFRPAYGVDTAPVVEALRAAQEDPTAAAIAYGRETGTCSCCGRELTNADSIALGIGPICLDRLGGAWG